MAKSDIQIHVEKRLTKLSEEFAKLRANNDPEQQEQIHLDMIDNLARRAELDLLMEVIHA